MFSFPLVPAGIGVIGGHRFCKLCCVGTKVLFVNGSRFVDNESHHSRGAVLCWVGDEGEPCGHLPVDDILLSSAGCMSSLARQDSEKITIERNVSGVVVRVTILARVSDERIDRAIELIGCFLPIQTVMLSLVADKFLCIFLVVA